MYKLRLNVHLFILLQLYLLYSDLYISHTLFIARYFTYYIQIHIISIFTHVFYIQYSSYKAQTHRYKSTTFISQSSQIIMWQKWSCISRKIVHIVWQIDKVNQTYTFSRQKIWMNIIKYVNVKRSMQLFIFKNSR